MKMRRIVFILIAGAMLCGALPIHALAGGEPASELVVVADTRKIVDSDYYHAFVKYIADAYNSNILVFAIWCTALTAAYGAFLGFLMDFLMSRTGLDLKSRKIIEH